MLISDDPHFGSTIVVRWEPGMNRRKKTKNSAKRKMSEMISVWPNDGRHIGTATMPDIKGYRLYVNLGASQVRKRVKGVGFGVRKIETAGRGQAVIIHTATGDHRRNLCALFEGLIERSSEEENAGEW
jgi:hypothetical protein